jgi:hypothetical protein
MTYFIFFLENTKEFSTLACCNNLTFGCGTYGAIQNFFTFVFSAVLIEENRKIIKLGNIKEATLGCLDNVYSDLSSFCTIAVPIAKALLAVSVLMLVSALAYIVVYIYTLIRVLQKNKADSYASNAGRNTGSNFPNERPESRIQMDSEQYKAPSQDQSYPRQKKEKRTRDVGDSQSERSNPMQQGQRRAPKVGYNKGGVLSDNF